MLRSASPRCFAEGPSPWGGGFPLGAEAAVAAPRQPLPDFPGPDPAGRSSGLVRGVSPVPWEKIRLRAGNPRPGT